MPDIAHLNFAEIPVTISMKTLQDTERLLDEMIALVKQARPFLDMLERTRLRIKSLKLARQTLATVATIQPKGTQDVIRRAYDSLAFPLKMEKACPH